MVRVGLAVMGVAGFLAVGSLPVTAQGSAPGAGRGAPASQPRAERTLLNEAGQVLTRLPVREGAGPVTQAVTRYDDWSLACEQRQHERTCFASTFVEVGPQVLKLKIGYAGPGAIRRSSPQAQEARSLRARAQEQSRIAENEARASDRRLVLSIEGPPSLDREVGFLLSSERFAAAVRFEECVRECVGSVALPDPARVVDGRGATVHILAAEASRAVMWTITTRGLEAAFKHLVEEMKAPEIARPSAAVDPQSLFERQAVPVPTGRAGGQVRTIDLRAGAAGPDSAPQVVGAGSGQVEGSTAARPPQRAAPRRGARQASTAPQRSARTAETSSDTFVPRSH